LGNKVHNDIEANGPFQSQVSRSHPVDAKGYNEMMIPFNAEAYTQESRKSWSDAAESYEKLSFALFGPIADELVLFSGIRKGWNVLDIACGPGIATSSSTAIISIQSKLREENL
jgi:hypothetical protein